VINALSHAWHPTQILADLLTLYETYSPPLNFEGSEFTPGKIGSEIQAWVRKNVDPLAVLKGKKIAWVGDMNNVSWELMATCPRLGMEMSVAAPKGYDGVDEEVVAKMYVTSFRGVGYRSRRPSTLLCVLAC
jgi:ornithine carbamoyltransferase